MAQFHQRVVRAALLDPHTYEEVEADREATPQAAAVVVLSAMAAGVGGLENHGVGGIVWHAAAQVIGWWIWAWIAYLVGTRLLPGPHTQADHGELLRTLGFSSAPGMLRVLGLFGPLAGVVFLICGVWMLVTMVLAVRHALDYAGFGRAIAVCAIGFPIYLVVQVTSLLLLGPWPV